MFLCVGLDDDPWDRIEESSSERVASCKCRGVPSTVPVVAPEIVPMCELPAVAASEWCVVTAPPGAAAVLCDAVRLRPTVVTIVATSAVVCDPALAVLVCVCPAAAALGDGRATAAEEPMVRRKARPAALDTGGWLPLWSDDKRVDGRVNGWG